MGSAIRGFFNLVCQWISDFFDAIVDAIASFFVWLWDCFMSLIEPFLETVNGYIPDLSSFWNSLSVIQPYTAFINRIIPLDTLSQFIGYYFVFIGAWLFFKVLIKLCPFIG